MAVQEAKRCISCGTCCVQACPYDVMQFNHEVTKAVKCDLCVEKRGRKRSLRVTQFVPRGVFSGVIRRRFRWGFIRCYKEAWRIRIRVRSLFG